MDGSTHDSQVLIDEEQVKHGDLHTAQLVPLTP